MNRRNVIAGTLAAAFVPVVEAKSHEQAKRELLMALANLPQEESMEITLLTIILRPGHCCRDYTLGLIEAGLPVGEVERRVKQRHNVCLYGPEGAPVYDENGEKIGGGYLGYWREHADG